MLPILRAQFIVNPDRRPSSDSSSRTWLHRQWSDSLAPELRQPSTGIVCSINLLPMTTPTLVRLRNAAFLAQRGFCFYCCMPMWRSARRQQFLTEYGLPSAAVDVLQVTAEHLRARQDGGQDCLSNIVAACLHCNRRRHQDVPATVRSPLNYMAFVQREMETGRWFAGLDKALGPPPRE
jgi:hypothetical protein